MKPASALSGFALPGLIRQGVVEEAPNLPQLKGARIQELLTQGLKTHGLDAKVVIMNDADAVASGLAATRGELDRLIRVWTLGIGIGYGPLPAGRRRLGGWPQRGHAGRQGKLL